MKREIKHPEKSASTGAYSAAIEIDGWLFVSGQGPLDMDSGLVCHGTIEEETRLTMQHIEKILAAAGCTFPDVVRCGCHLADIRDFDRFNRTYAEFFPVGPLPARTTVQSGLGDGIKVEIDCIARVPSGEGHVLRPELKNHR
ncbi:MAG: RidA family protein [Opitutaceae bacterium]|nr:RidA family protein [Opitutaceae bacterium]